MFQEQRVENVSYDSSSGYILFFLNDCEVTKKNTMRTKWYRLIMNINVGGAPFR